jgi:hypothetical protein
MIKPNATCYGEMDRRQRPIARLPAARVAPGLSAGAMAAMRWWAYLQRLNVVRSPASFALPPGDALGGAIAPRPVLWSVSERCGVKCGGIFLLMGPPAILGEPLAVPRFCLARCFAPDDGGLGVLDVAIKRLLATSGIAPEPGAG